MTEGGTGPARRWPLRLAGLGVLVALAAAAGLLADRGAVVSGADGPMAAEWVPLGELEWDEATTGWLGVANQHLPRKDLSFDAKPLSIGGIGFAHGIGTYPLSEITYPLDGRYARFTAQVGVDDAADEGAAGIRFLVYADGVQLFATDARRRGDPPVAVDVDLVGAQRLRLVVASTGESDVRLFADWAEPRLLRPVVGAPAANPEWIRRVRAEIAQRAAARTADAEALAKRSAALLAQIEPLADTPGPSNAPWLALGSRDLVLGLATTGQDAGKLYLFDRGSRQAALDGVRPSVAADGRVLAPSGPPSQVERLPADEPPFGRGRRLRAHFPLADGGEMVVDLALFDDGPYLLYQIELPGLCRNDTRSTAESRPSCAARTPGEAASSEVPRSASGDGTGAGSSPTFRFFDVATGEAAVGGGPQYVTDFSRLRHGVVRDDGIDRRETIGPGKPLFLWSDSAGRGLLLAALDDARGPTRFVARRDPGRVGVAVEYSSGPRRDAFEPISPRLYVELPRTVDLRASHANFKRISTALYPPAVVPAWFKYQWISWYAFNVDVDEAKLKAEIDYIADNLADLGPWNVLIDAGWYVAEGRPGADWRNVDRAKFPSGYRAIVDYAHSRGVRVVGYVSTPYLDSREKPGDWLGLRGVIEAHPDWLTQLGGDETHQSYAFDFARPEVRAYWSSVLRDLLVDYDVDGIKIDGLGNAEGALLSPDAVDAFGRVEAVADQTMEIYRFFASQINALKPDAYVQVGWMDSIFARPYAHTFWYSDEYPAFSNPYPFGGLREHVDYATIQRRLLGQRPHMGNPWDPADRSQINRWWLEAGLALGTKVAPSWDLAAESAESLAAYRHLLVHYDAFADDVRYGPGLRPEYFATSVGGTTYLGLMNRSSAPRTITPDFEELGLDPSAPYTAYDVEAQRYLKVTGRVSLELPPESFRLLIMRRQPGVLWTGSSFQLTPTAQGLRATVRGPASIPGDLALATPAPGHVTFDGVELAGGRPDGRRQPARYWYDAEAGVLHLRYRHDAPHAIDVVYAA